MQMARLIPARSALASSGDFDVDIVVAEVHLPAAALRVVDADLDVGMPVEGGQAVVRHEHQHAVHVRRQPLADRDPRRLRRDVQVVLAEAIGEPDLDGAPRDQAVGVEDLVAEDLVDDFRFCFRLADQDRAHHAGDVVRLQAGAELELHFFFPLPFDVVDVHRLVCAVQCFVISNIDSCFLPAKTMASLSSALIIRRFFLS